MQFLLLLFCTKLTLNHISSIQLHNSWCIWFQEAFNDKVVITCCLVQYWQIFFSFLTVFYYFTCLKAREISCKIRETWKIFPILHSAPCDNPDIFRVSIVNFEKVNPAGKYLFCWRDPWYEYYKVRPFSSLLREIKREHLQRKEIFKKLTLTSALLESLTGSYTV